jgi:hypothetical protein
VRRQVRRQAAQSSLQQGAKVVSQGHRLPLEGKYMQLDAYLNAKKKRLD